MIFNNKTTTRWLILAGLITQVHFSAQATLRHVDSNGLCAGLTPCSTTIQAAVNQAAPNDEIRVFSGLYVESVDLSLMGSDPGPATNGNISFITVDQNNLPTPHTVLVKSSVDPGFTHTDAAFTGNVTIDGFRITASADDGIDFDDVQGDLTIRHVISSGNDGDGIDLEFSQSGFTMHIEHTAVDSNLGHGLNLDGPDDTQVTIVNVQANNNLAEGIDVDFDGDDFFDNLPPDQISVNINNTQTIGNGTGSEDSAGVVVNSSAALMVNNLTTHDNAGPGLVVIDLLSTTIINSSFERNGQSADLAGILLVAAGVFEVARSVFIDNGGAAMVTMSTSVPGNAASAVNISCTRIANNGSGLFFDSALPVTTNIQAQNNNMVNNSAFGVFAGPDNDSIDFSNNWWGDATGPTHANNPGGMGDAVHDEFDDPLMQSPSGQVNYQSFLPAQLGIKTFAADTLFADGYDQGACQTFGTE